MGETLGFIEILDSRYDNIIFTSEEFEEIGDILQIIKTNNENEFAIACDEGLFFVTINLSELLPSIVINKKEYYFEGKSISCIFEVSDNVIMAAIKKDKNIKVVDRSTKSIGKTIF